MLCENTENSSTTTTTTITSKNKKRLKETKRCEDDRVWKGGRERCKNSRHYHIAQCTRVLFAFVCLFVEEVLDRECT